MPAVKLCQLCMVAQVVQMIIQFSISFNDAYMQFPFYIMLNIVTFVPHLYGLCLFAKYYMNDGNLNRACLPIATLIMSVITAVVIFQVLFIQLKDLGSYIKHEQLHIGVTADYSAQTSQGQSQRYRWKSNKQSQNQDKAPAIAITRPIERDGGTLLGFLIPLLIIELFWITAYSAFNSYVQRHLPEHQRQQKGGICCFGSSSSSRQRASQAARSRSSARQSQSQAA